MSAGMGDILFLLLTGGDPFLREDLPEIARIFCRNNHVRNLGIPTNGSLTDKIVERAEAILAGCPGIDFAIDISIDDIGERHDQIRNLPGLFDKAVYSYQELKRLTRLHPNFNLNVAVTVSHYNQHHLDELYQYLREKLGVQTVNLLLTRGKPRELEAGSVDLENYIRFSQRLERDSLRMDLPGYDGYSFSSVINAMKVIRSRLIARMIREQRAQIPCYAGNLGAIIYSNGDVYPCELLDRKFGNVREENFDFSRIWFSRTAQDTVSWIRKTHCFCTYECFLTNSIIFTPGMLPRLLLETFRLKFAQRGRRKNRREDCWHVSES